MNVNLISENYIKAVSIVGENVDSKFIGPAITKAQDIYLQPLIGSNLMEKVGILVQDELIDDPVNQDYKFLLDVYITPFLLQSVQAELIKNLFCKIRNQGIVQYSDISTTQLNTKDVQWMVQNFQNDQNFYGNRMVDYLCANSEKYPEWRQYNPKNNDMPANSNAKNLCQIVL